MTPAEREQVRADIELKSFNTIIKCKPARVIFTTDALAILDAEPAPVTDKDREEASKIIAIWLDADPKELCIDITQRAAIEIARIRKAAYEEGLRDGSKRE